MKADELFYQNLMHFESSEFDEPYEMEQEFLAGLDRARELAGLPFKLTSDWRQDEKSSHHTGKAVDIQARSSYVRFRIVQALMSVGFVRIGVYDRHVHVDMDDSRPYTVLWIGVSQ